MAASFVLLLSGGIIYASDIPIYSTDGCRNQTSEYNNGHCVSNGKHFFCAEDKWRKKDCVLAVEDNKDDGTIAKP